MSLATRTHARNPYLSPFRTQKRKTVHCFPPFQDAGSGTGAGTAGVPTVTVTGLRWKVAPRLAADGVQLNARPHS